MGEWEKGFVTSKGRFVTRQEGYRIANRAKQMDADEYRNLRNDGRPRLGQFNQHDMETMGLEAEAFNSTRRDWRGDGD